MHEIATIPFLDTQGFLSIRDEKTEDVYVSPKSICEAFSIDWGSQYRKLSVNRERWGLAKVSLLLPGDDQYREVVVIPDRKVRTWICGINSDKVKPEVRPQLEAFQEECDRVLYDYWSKGVAINPRQHGLMLNDFKQFIGEVVGSAVKSAVSEISATLVEKTVKLTIAEIRAEDPVYLAAKKWDVIERMHAAKPLPDAQVTAFQQTVFNMLLPGTKGMALAEMDLIHSAEFLHEKFLLGYRWKFKTMESAAGQLAVLALDISANGIVFRWRDYRQI